MKTNLLKNVKLLSSRLVDLPHPSHASFATSSKSLSATVGIKDDLASSTDVSKLKFGSNIEPKRASFPNEAKIVIVGGGAQGMAIAYKLAKLKYGKDIVVIDQGQVGGGSTWHSAGIIGQLARSAVETRLSRLSKELYDELEDKGYFTGWKQVGSVYVAQTKERLHYYKRLKSEALHQNIDCEVITDLDKLKEICPLIRVDDLEGALWVPTDGVANPFEICRALSALSQEKGVRMIQNCELKEVLVKNGSVSGVVTSKGYIKCKYFVNTAGMWAREIGHKSNPRVQIPLHTAEHYYLHTKPVADLFPNTPVVHDPDANIYFRENEGRFLAGGFEPEAKPIDELPNTVSKSELPVDWDHFHILLEGILHRVPSMGNAVLERLTNGPEPFSPDGNWVLGQAPEIRNYYVASAMRSIGIGAAGGVAELICNYIEKGYPSFDMHNLDIQRFLPAHNNRKFLKDRVQEVPSLFYSIPYPYQEFKQGRGLRTSPIFPKLRDAGARFNQIMGYERAMYFKPSDTPVDLGQFGMTGGFAGLDKQSESDTETKTVGKGSNAREIKVATTDTFHKPKWFDKVQEEFKAARENVAICDYSSFAKLDIWSAGDEVIDFLQYLCSNDVDVPVGTILNTGMHNVQGGYENDCSVARLAYNRYMLMSPSIQQMRSFTWVKHHLPEDGSVFLQDVTSLFTTLCIMGPKSSDVMANLTETDLSTFSHFTCRHLDIGSAPDILTMCMTHTGEMGYVMYIPSEFALHVFDSIMEAGKDFGIRHCGYYAMHAVRIEKFYAYWGYDLDSQSTPYECGRAFRVRMEDKNNINSQLDFIGKDAFLKQKREGITKILVMLLLDAGDHDTDTDPWPWGGEPIFRDGIYAGRVTTTAYGFSLNRHVCLGFVHDYDECGPEGCKFPPEGSVTNTITPDWVKAGEFEIEIGGIRYPADVRLNSPILPSMVRRAQVRDPGGATRYEDKSSSYQYEHADEKDARRIIPRIRTDDLDKFDEDKKELQKIKNITIRTDDLHDFD